MTFLGLEQPVAYGRELVFDPTTALMVLNANRDYINAVYNDYRLALADMKEFNKEYGDFLSPITKDMEWYDKNVTGDVRNFINNLYAQGIDPLRSAEGRALVTRKLASMPTGKIAQLRLSAEIAKEYIKAAGVLDAEGRYDPNAEKFFGRDLSTWSTLGDPENGIKASGIWGAASPVKSQTIDELIEPIIKNLDYTYDAERTKQANDGNDYYTVTEDRIRDTINDAMADLTRNGTMGGYYYNQALQQTGDPEKAKELYTQWLVNRGKDHLKEKFTPNEWKKMAKEHQYNMAEINARKRNSSGNQNDSDALGWTKRQQVASMLQNYITGDSVKGFDDWVKKNTNKGLTPTGLAAFSRYYSTTQHTPQPGDDLMANELFNAGGREETVKGLDTSGKQKKISFIDNDLRPTRIAEVQWAGKTLSKGSGSSKFAKYLKDYHIEGTPVGRATVNHQSVGNVDMYEINKNVRVKMSDVKKFFDKYPGERALKQMEYLGLTVVTRDGRQIDTSKKGGQRLSDIRYSDIEYVEIPTSRRIEAVGYDNSVIDTRSDALTLTKALAGKRESTYLDDDEQE